MPAPQETDVQDMPVQPPVDQPILNSPYYEPKEFWQYVGGKADKAPGRRIASYHWTTQKTGSAQQEMFASDQGADDLPLVNALREDLTKWRKSNYQNATPVTKELLRHWSDKDRKRRLFFCQLEAVETVIYLAEIVASNRRTQFKARVTHEEYQKLIGGQKPVLADQLAEDAEFYPSLADQPADASLAPLIRYGCKMATGSGKTVVMAMIITWAFCNRGRQPADPRFPQKVLVMAPNLTVRERLSVLRPDNPTGNYYDEFDMVPSTLRPLMNQGKVVVLNWHKLAKESPHAEGGSTYQVVDKGEESPEAFAVRVLKDLSAQPGDQLMVLNDEAHHAYRPKIDDVKAADKKKEKSVEVEKVSTDDLNEATIWVDGLDRLNEALDLQMVVDLSATPFYLQGTGHIPGSPFAWLVSDFGLVDAIESGITKIPRLPVSDTTGQPDPQFFRLWDHIKDNVSPSEKVRGKPTPEAVWREANSAIKILASQWKERFDSHQKAKPGQEFIPPVIIVVCDNVNIAQYFFEQISGQVTHIEETTVKGKKKKTSHTSYNPSQLFEELRNSENQTVTLRIDSDLLNKAEAGDSGSKQNEAERLRSQIANVGERGTEGEQIRCVVSVQMLTEGWDANNVTQILGLRAFGSQLLCEQVVGRGLRRMSYDFDPETEMLSEEYVDVYGIPFSVIPYKGRQTDAPAPEDKPKQHVQALPIRQMMRIEFPYVDGYTMEFKEPKIHCRFDDIDPLTINIREAPTEVFVMPQVGIRDGSITSIDFETQKQDKQAYYDEWHLQKIQFMMAQYIANILTDQYEEFQAYSRHVLFPQIVNIVEEFCESKVDYHGEDKRELAIERYFRLAVEKLLGAIRPGAVDNEAAPKILPRINRFTPKGSSDEVNFFTTRPCAPTTKSHVDQVVLDAETCEKCATYHLEASDAVDYYLRVDKSGFRIPYELLGVAHLYHPDFIVKLANGVNLVLEIKGFEREEDKAKHEAARRWCEAVSNWGKMGKWQFHVSKEPNQIQANLNTLNK
jgi:type III restriction enzyme